MAERAKEVEAYLEELTEERRDVLEAVFAVVAKNIDSKFDFGMQYGMPAWFLSHSEYPSGYHCDPKQPLPFFSIASQKRPVAVSTIMSW